MTLPYMPVVFSTPVTNPSVGSQGTPPIPYLSGSQFNFAPTATDGNNLIATGNFPSAKPQVLADVIRRASRWVDTHCFGADATTNGASLAASLSVESVNVRVKNGGLRLVCDYRPIVQVVGVDIGPTPGNVQSIGPQLASAISIGRRTIYVPLYGIPVRPGDVGSPVISVASGWSTYAVWSYVYGYPHTALAASVEQGATSCVVRATNGQGGVWGLFPGLTSLLISDGEYTETVQVTGITPGSSTATLDTSIFANAHTLPTAPDFIPASGMPDDITQAAISLTTVLIKARGSMAQVMPTSPGGQPNRQALAQAGALGDWNNAQRLLKPYRIRSKVKV